MEKQHHNVLVLSGCQATMQTITSSMIAVTGLAGLALADNKALATVPLTCYVLGSAVTTIPASLLMKAIGRRAGFQLGTGAGVIGGAVCAAALYAGSFWLLGFGMFLMGIYTAFGKYYRFAAADAASVDFRAKAISLTLAGGLLGGILGPEVAKHTAHAVTGYEYLGAYLSLIVVALLAMLLLTWLDIPMLSDGERRDSGRPLAEIMRQPVFIVAATAGMVSYGIMNLLMTSTPIAMHAHDHHFVDSAFVLQWHMIGMYAPAFLTGSLVQRFGAVTIILTGIVLNLLCLLSALAGTALLNFWAAMFLVGVGWNFMYVGGSTLLTECYTPAERAKTQAANDFLIFLTMAISSASSGLLLNKSGWDAVNYGSVPFMLLALVATLWLMWQRRRVSGTFTGGLGDRQNPPVTTAGARTGGKGS
jgi:MFS family permease